MILILIWIVSARENEMPMIGKVISTLIGMDFENQI